MPDTVRIVSPDALGDYTVAFREFNDGRYARAGERVITDYGDLSNLPSLEGVTIEGAKLATDYGLATMGAVDEALDSYATSDELAEAVSGLVTSSEVDNKLQGVTASVASMESTVSDLEAKVENEHPIGTEIISSTALNPAALYGGAWQVDSSHLFRGVYVYRRIS